MNPFNTPQGDPARPSITYKDLAGVRRLTQEEVLRAMPESELAAMVERLGKDRFVVLSRDGMTVVQDPATRLPFFHTNKKFAEMVAKEVGGVAVTWAEAVKVLSEKNKPNT